MNNIANFSLAGKDHSNQDSLIFHERSDKTLIAIADGMGGLESGEKASKIAVDLLLREFTNNSSMDFIRIIKDIKKTIQKYALENKIEKIGTTLTCCLIQGESAHIAHVGDCRLYQLRDHGLRTITKDQTEVQKLVDEGVLTPKRAKTYHRRNILLSALSNFSDFYVYEYKISLLENDRLLLMSDGAYSLLEKIEIRNLSVNNQNIDEFVNELKKFIISKKINDDYSALCYEHHIK